MRLILPNAMVDVNVLGDQVELSILPEPKDMAPYHVRLSPTASRQLSAILEVKADMAEGKS